jgi:hypothetical protein
VTGGDDDWSDGPNTAAAIALPAVSRCVAAIDVEPAAHSAVPARHGHIRTSRIRNLESSRAGRAAASARLRGFSKNASRSDTALERDV